MIIAIVGFIGSGKSTLADIIVKNSDFITDSFARPLKDAASVIFDWPRNMLEGATKESRAWREVPDVFWSEIIGRPFTPREALQKLGTEAVRNVFHEDTWVATLVKRNKGKNVVITDCRFRNEITSVWKHGGVVIRIKRGPEPDYYEAALRANNGDQGAQEVINAMGIHRSEYDFIGCQFDRVIENDGTLDDLENKIRALASTWEGVIFDK